MSEVMHIIGDAPFARSEWWKVHARDLGLRLGDPIPLHNLRQARKLPDGTYFIDSGDHLSVVTIPGGRIEGRWQHKVLIGNELVPMAAYLIEAASRSVALPEARPVVPPPL